MQQQAQSQPLQFIIGLNKLLADTAVIVNLLLLTAGMTADFVKQFVMQVAAYQTGQVLKISTLVPANETQKDFPGNICSIFA